jgi:hypothetical protein
MGAFGLSVPACDPRKPMRDVFDLDIDRGRVKQIQTAPGQHALPNASWGFSGRHS